MIFNLAKYSKLSSKLETMGFIFMVLALPIFILSTARTILAADEITVTLTEITGEGSEVTGLTATATSNDGGFLIRSMDYRVDGGEWVNVYSDATGISTYTFDVYNDSLPYDGASHTVDVRATDNFATDWPQPTGYLSGQLTSYPPVMVYMNPDEINGTLAWNANVMDMAYLIKTVDYQVDGAGEWINVFNVPAGEQYPSGTLNRADLTKGPHTIALRVTDILDGTWPTAGNMSVSFNGPNVAVTVTPDGYGNIQVDAYSNEPTLTVTTLEYSWDYGANWHTMEEQYNSYGTQSATGAISSYNLPPGLNDLSFRAIDVDDLEWPLDGPLTLESVAGVDDALFFESIYEVGWCEESDSSCISFATNGQGSLYLGQFQYRFNGGGWITAPVTWPTNQYQVEVRLLPADIPAGTDVLVEARMIDQDWGMFWPAEEAWGSITTSIGTGSGSGSNSIYTENFEDGVGTTIQGFDGTLDASIGTEWYAYTNTDAADEYDMRMRIQGDPFPNTGSGAITLDNPNNSAPAIPESLVLTTDLSAYTASTTLELSFDYAWHDISVFPSESSQMLQNKVYIRACDSCQWVTAYNLYANGVAGEYKHVVIDIDSLLGATVSSTFQVKFDANFEQAAISLGANEGYSLDNVVILENTAATDTTAPAISLSRDPSYEIADIYLSGTASDGESNISNVYLEYRNGDSSKKGLVMGMPNDGPFDSLSEQFYIDVVDLSDDNYTFDIYVFSVAGLQQKYSYNVQVGSTAEPVINFTVQPTPVMGKPAFPFPFSVRGTAICYGVGVNSITSAYFANSEVQSQPVGQPVDGEFEGNSEEFTLDFYNFITGNYIIDINLICGVGGKSYEFSGVIDDVPPTLEVDNLGQAPSENTTPTYTGIAADGFSNVASVEYLVYKDGVYIDWTPTIPTDGSFNSPSEAFSFQVSSPLVDGSYLISVRVTDSVGNQLGGVDGEVVDRIVINAVDTTPPIIELQPVIPEPTYDSTPEISGKVIDNSADKTTYISQLWYKLDDEDWTTINSFDAVYNDEMQEEFKFTLPELALGEHTLSLRAKDAANNDTEPGNNASISFSVIAQDPDIEPATVHKVSDFVTHTDHDTIMSQDTIWGRGILRLRQYVTLESQVGLVLGGTGPRYGYYSSLPRVDESVCDGGGVWISKDDDIFSYYNYGTATEYPFEISNYGMSWTQFLSSSDIKEYVTPGGECHVWVGGWNYLLGINFGTSIIDGINDTYTLYEPGVTGINTVFIDPRDPTNYGLYYTYTGGVRYLKPHSLATAADDQVQSYVNTANYNVDNIQNFLIRSKDGRNQVIMADYEDGVVVFDDNDTPLTLADDVTTTYTEHTGVFDIGIDEDNNLFFGGNWGLYVVLSDNDTFDAADDNVMLLVSTGELNQEGISRVEYLPGDSIIQDQFFIGTRSGQLTYYGTNGTYADKLDDELDLINVSNGVYPSEVADYYMTSDNSMILLMDRQGVFNVTFHREFAANGIAVSKIYSTLEGAYLDLDFITLNSIHLINDQGTYDYMISNDGGFTWKPITLGGTVNFDDPGYQFVFAINLHRGSTPVFDAFDLTYSAYGDEDDRGLLVDVANEPDEVPAGNPFDFDVGAFDDLLNPLEDPQVVNLQLRNVSTSLPDPTFSVASVPIGALAGLETVADAVSTSAVGQYRIYAYVGADPEAPTAFAYSGPIDFVAEGDSPGGPIIYEEVPPDEVPPVEVPPTSSPVDQGGNGGSQSNFPAITFTADKYKVQSGEEVTLDWSSFNIDVLNLSSQFTDYGIVDLKGSMTLNIYKTTEFTLQGTGAYGNITTVITIEVIGDEYLQADDTIGPPVIEYFDVEIVEEFEDKALVEVRWLVTNVDSVSITNVGDKLSPTGSTQIYTDSNKEFVLSAKNKYGEVSQSASVEYSPESSFKPAAIVPGVIAVSASLFMSMMSLSSGSLIQLGSDLLSRIGILVGIVVPRKKKYWGIVFDSLINEPIPFATVSIYDGNNLVVQGISDLDGKYGIALEKDGKYKMVTRAEGYNDFTIDFNATKVGGSAEVIEDVPMLKTGKKYGFLKKLKYYYKKRLFSIISKVILVLMVLGFSYSLVITIKYPVAINIFIMFIYALLFFANIVSLIKNTKMTSGRIIDEVSSEGIGGVSVRVYNEVQQIGLYLSNNMGLIKANLKYRDYYFFAYKKNYIMSLEDKDKKGEFGIMHVGNDGYMEEDITMKKVFDDTVGEKTKDIMVVNPFGKN